MVEAITAEALQTFMLNNFDGAGDIKETSTPPLAKGSFAYVFRSEDVAPGASGLVVRVTVAPSGRGQEFLFQKELQGLSAYLKLVNLPDTNPRTNGVISLVEEKQPLGICPIQAYYIRKIESYMAIITIMPYGKPLMDDIEEQLVAASEGVGGASRDVDSMVVGISRLAVALKYMHDNAIHWRDCKVDNIILIGGLTNIIDIHSGVCTVGYASHEQLNKLKLQARDLTDTQKVTDALENVLKEQPDHQTWVTQDVFALSIVVMEWLTYGMFTYPYNRDETSPSYAHLLLYELQVYNLLLKELSDVYDVTVLKGRLDRKIQHWSGIVQSPIDPTSQDVRDLTLWPLAVTEFKRDRRLFDMWAALAFWDHVDHQFGFIGHWIEWYFDFAGNVSPKASSGKAAEEAKESRETSHNANGNPEDDSKKSMAEWEERAKTTADPDLIKARISERKEQAEEDHAVRVVKRLTSLTRRMDSLNSSLSTFWANSPSSRSSTRSLPSVKVVYANPNKVVEVLEERRKDEAADLQLDKQTHLVEVRLRMHTSKSDSELRQSLLASLGKNTTSQEPC
ncbi:hypothetical protein GUITHDRAFT_140714 [Guillardia theta CCMP2712]|uniref:Protein kinase domain-containing protein n=1 Tax=Guillardia theta (strain CCMP2712) TaxID=905079 RepID=L1J474_GUITC|nr:hypothetical protein GUITHDRAFT_140714 [Guillardia theta CCMP2712]EKX43137.1 hypothetical protein GUITHDRAFT_140714 [Guillardia theta CCMP2712]|mmetsp:Transcript_9872/g.33018  ORF Transcript_9872/g.33018 Transcript_9872/m.33018 type:complete len:565 (-) Transcript_9872:152-1846(-)|eukprot:XP_005830117.1 hypothetical protein GUITHDRAFT_140714 [Guillardia theta CCMP2712]